MVHERSGCPPLPVLKMSREKAISILSDLERGIYTSQDPDVKMALAIAKAALITQQLHLGDD